MTSIRWAGSGLVSVALLGLAGCGGDGGGFDPGNLTGELLAKLPMNAGVTTAFAAEVRDGYAYAKSYYGLVVVQLGAGTDASIVATSDVVPLTPSESRVINWVGQTLLIGHGGRVVAFDVSNPAAPLQLSDVGFPSAIYDLAVVGSRVYVAAETSGVAVYDYANPAAPTMVGQINNEQVYGVAANANNVFTINQTQLKVFDTSPSWNAVAAVETITGRDLEIDGSHLIASLGYGGRGLVDIATPSAPMIHVNDMGMPGSICSGRLNRVGDRMYDACEDRPPLVFDVTNLDTAEKLFPIPTQYVTTVHGATASPDFLVLSADDGLVLCR